MRTLGSDELREQKRKKLGFWLSMFMLFILVGSTAGFAFLSHGGSNSEGDNSHLTDGSEYGAYDPDTSLVYTYEDVRAVPVNIVKTLDSYTGKAVYVNSVSRVAINEINIALGGRVNRVQEACYGDCDLDLPEKICDDSNEENVIVVKESEFNNVYEENGCVFIEGNTKAVDAFLYGLFSS
jgi:hypothetical protein